MIPGQPLIDFGWIFEHLDDIALRIWQHVILTAIPVAIGFGVALVLGIWIVRKPVAYGPVTVVSGLLYTIPSLAFFAVLIPITGISLVTAVIPLVTLTRSRSVMGPHRNGPWLHATLLLVVTLVVALNLTLITLLWVDWYARSTGRRSLLQRRIPRWAPAAGIAVAVAFAVVRNLPGVDGLRG